MNKFYIFLGSTFGNIAWNKKHFKLEVETFFSGQSVTVKQIDIRQTHGNRYHAFVTLLFLSNEKMKVFDSLIRCASTKYIVINDTWKIYKYISKSERLNTAFCDDNDEEVIDSGENVFEDEVQGTTDEGTTDEGTTDEGTTDEGTNDEIQATTYKVQGTNDEIQATTNEVQGTTYEYDEHPNEGEISYINPVYEYEDNEYESIYTWLVTPQLHEIKKAEEMKELCRWLSTSFWERT
jgi:hypothetical protein